MASFTIPVTGIRRTFLTMATAAMLLGSGQAMNPVTVKLHRQQIPLHNTDGVVHHKSAYYGSISVGGPEPQVFDMVFDTGSGHVVIPSSMCRMNTCKKHRRFQSRTSQTANDIDVDGTVINAWDARDQITVAFGTGEVTGIFMTDWICLGAPGVQTAATTEQSPQSTQGPVMLQQSSKVNGNVTIIEEKYGVDRLGCINMGFVAAIAMTDDPFDAFDFDGVMGLGLTSLSETPKYNFLSEAALGGAWPKGETAHMFSVFLATSENEDSEITFAGYRPERFREGDSISWCTARDEDHGHWQVDVRSISAGGVRLPFCDDGTCRAVVDTGTSLLGIPSAFGPQVVRNLRHRSEIRGSCQAPGPQLEIEFDGVTLVLDPVDFARPEHVPNLNADFEEDKNSTEYWKSFNCVPMLMHIDLPLPLSPKTLILGEPVLQKYYTIFDASKPRVGFVPARHAAPDTVTV